MSNIEIMASLQVPIVRRTGLPVELNDMNMYKEEFRRLFDRAENILKREAAKKGNKTPDMLSMQARIAKIERALTKKYPTIQEVPLPITVQEWISLQAKYGNILVTRKLDSEEVVLVIEDQDQFSY
jgi:hypothetical protein